MNEQQGPRIVQGAVYRYTSEIPAGCRGHLYRVVSINVLAVPEYTEKVLCEALTGKDKGLFFVCSPFNFVRRYEGPVDEGAAG